mmetsp:Transcript_12391/g.35378  ORF Transcript_12391/g.35378 Transcript_12391/m.35378 type:complete len:348 (-) Transcript_12391:849-1892(-)
MGLSPRKVTPHASCPHTFVAAQMMPSKFCTRRILFVRNAPRHVSRSDGSGHVTSTGMPRFLHAAMTWPRAMPPSTMESGAVCNLRDVASPVFVALPGVATMTKRFVIVPSRRRPSSMLRSASQQTASGTSPAALAASNSSSRRSRIHATSLISGLCRGGPTTNATRRFAGGASSRGTGVAIALMYTAACCTEPLTQTKTTTIIGVPFPESSPESRTTSIAFRWDMSRSRLARSSGRSSPGLLRIDRASRSTWSASSPGSRSARADVYTPVPPSVSISGSRMSTTCCFTEGTPCAALGANSTTRAPFSAPVSAPSPPRSGALGSPTGRSSNTNVWLMHRNHGRPHVCF